MTKISLVPVPAYFLYLSGAAEYTSLQWALQNQVVSVPLTTWSVQLASFSIPQTGSVVLAAAIADGAPVSAFLVSSVAGPEEQEAHRSADAISAEYFIGKSLL